MNKQIRMPRPGMRQPHEANLYNLVALQLCDHLEFNVGLPVIWQLGEVYEEELATRVTDG